MVRSLVVAVAVALAVPSAAFACAAHRQQNAAKAAAQGEQVKLAQAAPTTAGDAKKATATGTTAATGTTGTTAATGAKKAKPKAGALSNPKAAVPAK
jgi:hypothetical protein